MIPKSWNDISVYQYQELRGLNASDSVFEWHLDVLDLLTELEVDELTLPEVDKIFKELQWLKKEPHRVYKKHIVNYQPKEFKDIRLGEFLDLEHYTQDKVKNLTTIAAIFYRKIKINEWGQTVYEPYEYDPVKRGEEFLDYPITHIYGLVEEWIKYRNYLINDAYSNLFDSGSISEEELEELDPEERAQILKDEAEQKKFSRWAWESIIDAFAQGDKTKYRKVYDLKLIFVLNQLSKEAELK